MYSSTAARYVNTDSNEIDVENADEPYLFKVVSRIINIARGPTWIVPHIFSEDGAVQRLCKHDQQVFPY